MDNKLYLEELEKNRAELAEVVPEFKPQYANKHADGKQYKTQTLREIAEHSNYFKIEIHPNIIDELIARERLDRANKFIKGKLEKLTADELNDLQIDINLVMFDQQIERTREQIALDAPPIIGESSPALVSDNKFSEVEVNEEDAVVLHGTKSIHDGKKPPSKKGKK